MHVTGCGILEVLEQVCTIPDGEKERFLSLLKPLELSAGDFFLRSGDKANRVAFMTRGLLRYYYSSSDGREHTRHFCTGGGFVVPVAAVWTADGMGVSKYNVQALEECIFEVFAVSDWKQLIASHTVWGTVSFAFLSEALGWAERRERSLVLDDAKTRYLDMKRQYPGIEERVRQYHIASFLGISPVALSRIRAQLSESSLV